eukprot:TRINITY_DN19757_c0_g1_i1.p3 TRINITY_DN19757_c0_g1~~TRINITY_DN19757_c0_g1_i1.p3  ORF type:complete len:493 (-),score=121.34 TRINITY_DN19757_c0_g1_i1:5745-7223(-)
MPNSSEHAVGPSGAHLAPPPGLASTGRARAEAMWPQHLAHPRHDSTAPQQKREPRRVSRSPRVAADRQQQPAAPAAPATDLLLQQLADQLALQNVKQQLNSAQYLDPWRILRQVDPSFRSVLSSWHKEAKQAIEFFVTQSELADKYAKISESGGLLRQLADEAKKGHQWPQVYLAVAEPTDHAADLNFVANQVHNEMQEQQQFKVDEVYLQLRLKHAKECQQYLFAHQSKMMALATSKASPQQLQLLFNDKVRLWFASNPHLSQDAAASVRHFAQEFFNLTLRTELPKAKARIEKEKEKQAKREQAQQNANSKFEQLNMKSLIALAALESKGRNGNERKNASMKHVTEGSVLHYLLKEQPEIAKDMNIKVSGQSPPSASKEKPAKHKSSSKSRSASRSSKSALSSRSASARSWIPTHARSRSSSVRSVRFHEQSLRSSKGKGKGKRGGKGKGKGNHRSASAEKPPVQNGSRGNAHQASSQARGRTPHRGRRR